VGIKILRAGSAVSPQKEEKKVIPKPRKHVDTTSVVKV